jgi:hypothetical protein
MCRGLARIAAKPLALMITRSRSRADSIHARQAAIAVTELFLSMGFSAMVLAWPRR